MSFLRKFGKTVRFITGNLTEEERKQELKNITHKDDLSFYEGTIREVEDKREPNWTSDMVKEFFANNNAEANKKVRQYFWKRHHDCSDLINKGYIEGNFWFSDDD